MPGPESGVEVASAVGAFGHSAEDRSLVQEAEALFGRGVPDHHALYEQDLEAALRNPANLRNWGAARHEVKCQNCHAISVFVNGKVADRCDFCGSPAIVTHEEMRDAITPQSLLPFRISESQVRTIDPSGSYSIGIDVEPARGYADTGNLSLDLQDMPAKIGRAQRSKNMKRILQRTIRSDSIHGGPHRSRPPRASRKKKKVDTRCAAHHAPGFR